MIKRFSLYIEGLNINTMTIIIAKKRLWKETEDEYVFLTSTYGGEFFSIKKKDVISKDRSKIKVNDVYDNPAYKLVIKEKAFDRIFKKLEKISDFDLIIDFD